MHRGVTTLLVEGIPCSVRVTPKLIGGAPPRLQTLSGFEPQFAPMGVAYVRPIATPRVGATRAAGNGH